MIESEVPPLGESEPIACSRCGDFAELIDYDGLEICEACIDRLSEIERTPPTVGSLLAGSLWLLARIGPVAALMVAAVDLPMALIEVFVPEVPPIVSTIYGATLSIVAQGAVFHLAHRCIRGEPLDLPRSIRAAGDNAVNIVGANFLAALQVFLYALLLIVPGVLRSLSLTLALPIAANEDLSPTDALKASAERTKGHRGSVFIAYLVWGSLWLMGFGAYIAFTVAVDTPGALPLSEPVVLILLVLGGLLMPVLMIPVVCTTATLYAKTLRYRAA